MPLPNAKAIRDALEACTTPAERAALKADYVGQFFAAAKVGASYTYTYEVYAITVTGAERVGNALWFTCSATRDGSPVDLGEGRFGFVNPPLQVPDGTSSDVTDPATGQTLKVANFKISVLDALKGFLGQAVSEYVIRHG